MTDISVFLDIPDIEVRGIERSKNGDYHISVKSAQKSTKCKKCGKHSFCGYNVLTNHANYQRASFLISHHR